MQAKQPKDDQGTKPEDATKGAPGGVLSPTSASDGSGFTLSGDVAYVAQSAFIQNATIKGNIMFNRYTVHSTTIP
jgi:hypothetical protein